VTSGASTTSGTVIAQGSLDGASWYQLGTGSVAITTASTVSPALVSSATPFRFVRGYVSTAPNASGSISAFVGAAG
jgi:hypothetical protein